MKQLLSAAAVASAFSALANTVWVFHEGGGGRVRDTGLCHILRSFFFEFDLDPLRSLPTVFRHHRELSSWDDFISFLALAIALNVVIGLTVALVFAAISAAMKRLRNPRWHVLPKALAVTLCLLPAIMIPATTLELVGRRLGHWLLVTLMLVGVWLILGAVLAALWLRWQRAGHFLATRFRTVAVLFLALVAVVMIVEVGKPSTPMPPPGSPNILLISIDSLRQDHLSAYGYARPTSPSIDALAREGVRFDSAVAPTSWTLPSHVELLTALPARLHGVRDSFERFSTDVKTLAEVLSDAGYSTAGFAAGIFLNSTHGFAQGFDHYDDYTILDRDRNENEIHITSPTSVDLVQRWLAERDRSDHPFFIFLHMWDVHFDYRPPPPYDTMFDPDYTGDITGELLIENPAVNADMPQRDLEHIIALYDGEIRFTDEHLGRLFNLLAERGDLDETLVVVTADHGEEFFEHGGKAHDSSLYDELIRIPLVMRYPRRIPAGTIVEDQVRLLDVAPTILSLAGIERPESFGYNGPAVSAARDLTPMILGPDAGEPRLLAFGHLRRDVVSIRTETSKLVRHTKWKKALLYDLVDDPGEQSNLIGNNDQQTEVSLNELLDQWWSGSVGDPLPAELNQQQIKVLRSLGYLE